MHGHWSLKRKGNGDDATGHGDCINADTYIHTYIHTFTILLSYMCIEGVSTKCVDTSV